MKKTKELPKPPNIIKGTKKEQLIHIRNLEDNHALVSLICLKMDELIENEVFLNADELESLLTAKATLEKVKDSAYSIAAKETREFIKTVHENDKINHSKNQTENEYY